MTQRAPFALLMSGSILAGCAADTGSYDITKRDPLKGDASAEAVFVDFEFDGELLTDSTWGLESKIEDQLLYTIGHLNGDRGVGRLDTVELSAIESAPAEGGLTRVTYHARLPVAWARQNEVRRSYTLRLPRNATYAGYEAFAEKYGHSCVDTGAHDVDSGSMWYYYRPSAFRCQLDPADIVSIPVVVTPSDRQTTGKFPEYDMVWSDGELQVVAVFGKYEDGATTANDAGIAAYNTFVREVRSMLSSYGLTTTPAMVPTSPGVAAPDITFSATLPDGGRIQIVALLVDNVRTGGRTFDDRYAALSTRADFIVYNGHAGLGANVRALATKGRWTAGQYAIVMMNGCDTYAYIDNALWDAHAAVNPDDTQGTRYMDIVTNGMPAFFREMPDATLAVLRALLDRAAPKTYEQIFSDVDQSQIVLVSGEHDNVFVPGGGGGGGGEPWAGLMESVRVTRNQEARFETPMLGAGHYLFEMSGSGDADLYVRIGNAPTERLYDCRPYKSSSNERCAVELPAAAQLHLMVRGYASSSSVQLVGRPE